MNRIHNYLTLMCMAFLLFVTAGCQHEEVSLVPETSMGKIVLNLFSGEAFADVITRSSETELSSYDFILKKGNQIVPVTFSFADGEVSAIIEAGTYTLTVTSNTAQNAGPWYQATSEPFVLDVGAITPVSINLGKPKNVEIAVTFAESFTNLYDNYSVTIGSNTLTSNGNLYAMPDAEGKVSYTIKSSAKQGSHVSEIPSEGVTGKLDVTAGNSYPLNITASTITDLLIEFGEGTHNGEFDTKEHHLF